MAVDRKNESIHFQTCPKTLPNTRPTECWLAKSGPVPVNLLVSIGVARSVCSRLQFCVSRFTFIVAFKYATVNGKVLVMYQQKIFPSGRNGFIRVDALCQNRQRHPGGWLLRARPQYHASRCISRSNRCFAISSCTVSLLLYTNTLALWPTVIIRQNGFIGSGLASGLHCDGRRCENLCSRSFYLCAKCNSHFTNYTHQSKSPDLCGYWQFIARSVRLLSYY